jgi:hypothetical protein
MKRESLGNQMRRLIANSEQSQYAISKATGIDKSSLSKFVAGERGLLLPQIEKIADFLGWKIVATKPTGTKVIKRKSSGGRTRGQHL